MTPDTELDRLFAASLAKIPKPEKPMPYVTIPAETPPERDPGIVDVTPETLADRDTVADIRDALRKRDRNATPRSGGDEPEAA